MTQDEIIEMAREAGGCDIKISGYTSWVGTQTTEFLERFANLVAAKYEQKIQHLEDLITELQERQA